MQGVALVDFDNVCGYRIQTRADCDLHTTALLDTLARAFGTAFPALRELDVRLYGGWTDESGIPSPAASRLLPIIPVLRGRRHGLIVRPSLALAMCQFPDLILRGTVRMQSRNRLQKMVDGMLGCDAMFIAAGGLTPIGIVTDDDDLLPATLSAHITNPARTVWMRRRPAGTGLNDKYLADRRLPIRRHEDPIHA